MMLFGRELFNRQPQVMYDFAQHGLVNGASDIFIVTEEDYNGMKKKAKKKADEKILITPKGVFHLQMLNDNKFSINTDPEYLEKQLDDCRKKLEIVKQDNRSKKKDMNWGGGVYFGRLELESLIERLENRKKINSVKEVLEKYPHTTNKKINDVVTKNSHLRCKRADEFIPDFPTEAIKAMGEYNEMCKKLTGKTTWFYVIADKVDFGEKNKKRDPILLAQSPFGFFWQILGAWDEEMVLLDEL